MSWDSIADGILAIVPIATLAIGAGTAVAGIFTYQRKKKNESLTQIVLPVLTEYSDLKDADIAVDILNDILMSSSKQMTQRHFTFTVDEFPKKTCH